MRTSICPFDPLHLETRHFSTGSTVLKAFDFLNFELTSVRSLLCVTITVGGAASGVLSFSRFV